MTIETGKKKKLVKQIFSFYLFIYLFFIKGKVGKRKQTLDSSVCYSLSWLAVKGPS